MIEAHIPVPAQPKPQTLFLGQLLYSEDDDTLILITYIHSPMLGSGIRVSKSGFVTVQGVSLVGCHRWREAPAGSFLKFTQE